MNIKIQAVKVGKERTNCYVVSLDSGETAVVDPGAEAEKIFALLNDIQDLKLKYILLTHGHFDHVGAVDDLKKLYPDTPVMIGEEDVRLYDEVPEQGIFVGQILKQPKAALEAVRDGEFISFGSEEIEVIATPGHTPGGVCYILHNFSFNGSKYQKSNGESPRQASNDIMFTGDTLFYHTIGRTDLPFSNDHEMGLSLDKLKHLDHKTEIYPGHGKPSTISEEVANNPYLA